MRRAWILLACAACARDAPPPLPEAIVIVDTDLPVPRVVSRLRIDLYSEDGTWFDSRDDLRPDPRDWPTSFSVYTDDESRGRTVFVRLRAYPDARLVRYTGAIYAPFSDLLRGVPRGTGTPRLVVDGVDRTPSLEPDPTVTIDRLVKVRLAPGARGRARVVLRGACAGAMAKIDPISEAGSCVDGGEPLTGAIDAALEEVGGPDAPSEVGSFARASCDGAPEGKSCIEGGAFVLGDAFYSPTTTVGIQQSVSHPERVVALSRFLVDTDEVSVARYRAAIAGGFTPPRAVGVLEKDGAVGDKPDAACTFSASPRGREDYPLSCVPWETARAFCQRDGGDLPTEAQWEYAAVAAARPTKSIYPWGDDPPTCDLAIYARSPAIPDCLARGVGPQPLATPGDVSAAGVKNLAGSLGELLLDNAQTYTDRCWLDAPMRDPSCILPVPPECEGDPTTLECRDEPALGHAVRGGSWFDDERALRIVDRSNAAGVGFGTDNALVGFRCVYSAP